MKTSAPLQLPGVPYCIQERYGNVLLKFVKGMLLGRDAREGEVDVLEP